MANWLKVNKPNVETSGAGFVGYNTALINLDAATSFAIQVAGTVTVFIDGKGYVVSQGTDDKAYKIVMEYIQTRTQGQSLP
jgi:hypothetical protein